MNHYPCARSDIDLPQGVTHFCGCGLWRGRVMMLDNQRDPLPGGPCVMVAWLGAEDLSRAPLHKTIVSLQLMVSLQTMVSTIDFLILIGYGAVLLW